MLELDCDLKCISFSNSCTILLCCHCATVLCPLAPRKSPSFLSARLCKQWQCFGFAWHVSTPSWLILMDSRGRKGTSCSPVSQVSKSLNWKGKWLVQGQTRWRQKQLHIFWLQAQCPVCFFTATSELLSDSWVEWSWKAGRLFDNLLSTTSWELNLRGRFRKVTLSFFVQRKEQRDKFSDPQVIDLRKRSWFC